MYNKIRKSFKTIIPHISVYKPTIFGQFFGSKVADGLIHEYKKFTKTDILKGNTEHCKSKKLYKILQIFIKI